MNTSSRRFSFRLVTSSYLPIVGGSEVEAQRVCAALVRRGHQAEVYCPGGPAMPADAYRVDADGVPVRQFGNTRDLRLRGYLFAAAVAWQLWRTRSQYDLVYFLMTGAHVVSGIVVARLLGKPVLMKFSGSNTIRPLLDSPVGRLQLKLLSRWASRIMVLNDAMREEGKQCGLKEDKLAWMPNPVDTEEFQPATAQQRAALRQSFELEQGAEVVLFVGRLAPEKELDSLVEAFAGVAVKRPQARLVLVGDGPRRAGLEALVHQRGLETCVRFTGVQAAPQVRAWLQAADVFALVSSVEGLPVSLIEAMAVGLPAVVSDIPASTQLIQAEQNGLVAQLRDVDALQAAILRLLESPADRDRMGQQARRRVEHDYSTATVASSYETLFAEACAEAVR